MCERSRFSRWLTEDLRHYPRKLLNLVTHPVCQVGYSLSSISLSLVFAFGKDSIFALLLVPSFLLMIHGIYRVEVDC